MESYASVSFQPSFYQGSEQTVCTSKYCDPQTSTTDRPMDVELTDLKGYEILSPVYVIRNNARDGRVFLSSKDLNIFSSGSTLDESKLDFAEHLDFVWDEYVSCDPSELHDSSMEYRQWIIDHFKRLE